ncbi:hypothetical protein SSAG_01101 [Streptomyces sp. Mg1]|nr:hypothetical protein SSAG_01101 [Streptomyces sp. Mg1]
MSDDNNVITIKIRGHEKPPSKRYTGSRPCSCPAGRADCGARPARTKYRFSSTRTSQEVPVRAATSTLTTLRAQARFCGEPAHPAE